MINNADVLIQLCTRECDKFLSVCMSLSGTVSPCIMFHYEINLLCLTYHHPDANCLQATDEVAYCDYNHR